MYFANWLDDWEHLQRWFGKFDDRTAVSIKKYEDEANKKNVM